jgi:hypothetical protein
MDYDLSLIEELIEFDAACLDAKHESPQYKELSLVTGYSHPSPFSVACVFRHHFNCRVLWQLGYHKHLSSRAKNTFNRYAVFRSGEIYDTKNKTMLKASDMTRLQTTFRTASA